MENGTLGAMTKVVEALTPLSSEDRARVVSAALALLGEAQPAGASRAGGDDGTDKQDAELGALPPRARTWMKQHDISADQLQQVFHISGGELEIIAAHIPGKSKKEQTYSAYILTGLGQLLLTGNSSFQDKQARALCESSGCYDLANHSAHLRDRGNEFAGTKDKGWTLTTPGLQRASEIVKELTRHRHD